MSILKLFFQLFVIYILYKFIFDFIIPVYKTTKQVKQKMSDMQQQMQQNQAAQQGNPYQNRQKAEETPKRAASEDYIDYEEIK
jgi:Sec-independent protein translocase protein TatA